MAKMSDKTKRAINKGRRKAGLKPINFGAKSKRAKFVAGFEDKKIGKFVERKKPRISKAYIQEHKNWIMRVLAGSDKEFARKNRTEKLRYLRDLPKYIQRVMAQISYL